MSKRKRKNITLPNEIYDWIQHQIDKGRFYNFSHACEIALKKLKEQE